jgi:superoxide reductase
VTGKAAGQKKTSSLHLPVSNRHTLNDSEEITDNSRKTKGRLMTQRLQIYKCEICGNIVEMLHGGAGELVCCGQPMKLYKANTVDAVREKHVPVLDKVPGGFKVTIGSVPHPMEQKHYIEWIELQAGEAIQRRFLKPGDAPEAVFSIDATRVSARAYCNLHGLWQN